MSCLVCKFFFSFSVGILPTAFNTVSHLVNNSGTVAFFMHQLHYATAITILSINFFRRIILFFVMSVLAQPFWEVFHSCIQRGNKFLLK